MHSAIGNGDRHGIKYALNSKYEPQFMISFFLMALWSQFYRNIPKTLNKYMYIQGNCWK